MTEAFANYTQETNEIQCNLCLHEISIPSNVSDANAGDGLAKQTTWVQCPVCNYHQPIKKTPGLKDLLVFGGVIGSVYIATIVAVLVTR